MINFALLAKSLIQTSPFLTTNASLLDLLRSVQSLSRVRFFTTPWTAAYQAFLFITNSQSLLKLMSIQSVTPSNHLILCHPLLFLPSIFPSIRVFSLVTSSHQEGKSIGVSASASVLPMNIQSACKESSWHAIKLHTCWILGHLQKSLWVFPGVVISPVLPLETAQPQGKAQIWEPIPRKTHHWCTGSTPAQSIAAMSP